MVPSSVSVATGAWTGPLVVSAAGPPSMETWAAERQPWIADALVEHGALLLRGFGVTSVDAFRAASAALLGQADEYRYQSTPRTLIEKGIYTATEYPADAAIPMHNENAYQRDWPTRLVFCCLQPAATGGETPLARTANVTARVGDDIVRMFAERRVLYVRNYGHGVDLPWETVFQTRSREDVEAYCRDESIEWEWLPGGRLRTRQVAQGVAAHPGTHQELFFNQAHLFHISSLGAEGQALMLEVFDEVDVPRHAYFGDGGRIPESLLARVRAAFDAEAVTFAWEPGDVLLVDNMLVAHGRRPFTGARKVLVSMGDPFSRAPRT